MIRIVAGAAKGRQVRVPANSSIRPTTSVVREAIFDLMGADVAGSHVLDLFAGSGSLGLEALSRNASSVLFVDHDQAAVRTIRENLSSLGYSDRGEVWCCSHARAIERLRRMGKRFEVILSDPPYGFGGNNDIVGCLDSLLAPGGAAAMESSRDQQTPLDTVPPASVARTTTRLYGRTRVTVYRRTCSPDAETAPSVQSECP